MIQICSVKRKNKKNKYHKKLESTCEIIESKRVF